jgi:hypothetical protein
MSERPAHESQPLANAVAVGSVGSTVRQTRRPHATDTIRRFARPAPTVRRPTRLKGAPDQRS